MAGAFDAYSDDELQRIAQGGQPTQDLSGYSDKELEDMAGPAPSEGNFLSNFGKGIYTGITRRVPEQIGQAMQFSGVAPEAGKKLADWATEGEPEKEKGMFEQAGEMMPLSMAVPAVMMGAGKAIGLIPHPIAKAAGMGLTLAGKYGAPLMFGLSQAQQTRETAQERGVEEGIAPHVTGAIEFAGETVANMALGRLFGSLAGATKIAERTLKDSVMPTLGRFTKQLALKTLPTEILTEMGQNYSEAMVEKQAGIRPEAEPLQEALGAIGPTAIMTIATGGLLHPATAYQNNRIMKTLSDPEVDQNKRLEIANSITRMINEDYKDPETAKMWERYAISRIAPEDNVPKPIDINMMMDKTSLEVQELQDSLVRDLGQEEEFKTAPPPEEAPTQTQPQAQPQVTPEQAAAPIVETPPTEPPVAPAPVEQERPSPVQPGRIVVWNEPNNIQGKGRIMEILPDRGLARVRYSEGYGGAQRETLRDINDLRPMNIQETSQRGPSDSLSNSGGLRRQERRTTTEQANPSNYITNQIEDSK